MRDRTVPLNVKPEAAPRHAAAPSDSGGREIRDLEICRMAAFRIREAANRIATLASSAQDPDLQRQLELLRERLLAEERLLLDVRHPRGD